LQFWFNTVFPVVYGRYGDADDLGNFSLEESEIHSFLANVVTDCVWTLWITGNW
jgi:hypothetical protein